MAQLAELTSPRAGSMDGYTTVSQLVAYHNLQHVHTAYVAQLNLVLGFNLPRT